MLKDLRKDFGFCVGPWNQAYMFDTLPNEIKCEEEMQPGDLVFISGIYMNEKRTPGGGAPVVNLPVKGKPRRPTTAVDRFEAASHFYHNHCYVAGLLV